jgi:hypothetical protein
MVTPSLQSRSSATPSAWIDAACSLPPIPVHDDTAVKLSLAEENAADLSTDSLPMHG